MTQRYKTGDLVKLKSGGPVMTVSSYTYAPNDDSEVAKCKWFAGAKAESADFHQDVLVDFAPEVAKK